MDGFATWQPLCEKIWFEYMHEHVKNVGCTIYTQYYTQFFTSGLSFSLIHMTPKGQRTPDETESYEKWVSA